MLISLPGGLRIEYRPLQTSAPPEYDVCRTLRMTPEYVLIPIVHYESGGYAVSEWTWVDEGRIGADLFDRLRYWQPPQEIAR